MANLGVVTLTDNEWLELDGADCVHAGSDSTITLGETVTLEVKRGDRVFYYVGDSTDIPSDEEYFEIKSGERATISIANGESVLLNHNLTNGTSIINVGE